MSKAIKYIEERIKATEEQKLEFIKSGNKYGESIINSQLISLKDLKNVLFLIKKEQDYDKHLQR